MIVCKTDKPNRIPAGTDPTEASPSPTPTGPSAPVASAITTALQ